MKKDHLQIFINVESLVSLALCVLSELVKLKKKKKSWSQAELQAFMYTRVYSVTTFLENGHFVTQFFDIHQIN